MSRISQEFYCHECNGFFVVRLNINLNHEAEIVCPNCGHEHRRCIKDGQIYESGRYQTDSKERVFPTKSTYSKQPLTEKMLKGTRRNGVPIMAEQWLNVLARERGED